MTTTRMSESSKASSGGVVQLSDLPDRLLGGSGKVAGIVRIEGAAVDGVSQADDFASFEGSERSESPATLAEMERRHLIRVLRFCNGNKRKASTILDVDRKTLGRMIERHGVEVAALTTVEDEVALVRSATARDEAT